jgi:hypothetical protein
VPRLRIVETVSMDAYIQAGYDEQRGVKKVLA